MRLAGVAFAAITCLQCALAQETPIPVVSNQSAIDPPRDFENYFPTVNAQRIDEEDAPVIDGDLSDLAWLGAALIEEFYQVEPTEGAAPSQPTRAYVMYDAKNLYIGVYAYDSDPDLIRRSQLARDPDLRDDDGIRILIDSYGE